jgi:hypothetical protein
VRAILTGVSTIAIVGASPNPARGRRGRESKPTATKTKRIATKTKSAATKTKFLEGNQNGLLSKSIHLVSRLAGYRAAGGNFESSDPTSRVRCGRPF